MKHLLISAILLSISMSFSKPHPPHVEIDSTNILTQFYLDSYLRAVKSL